jgi:hypothetical protein
MATLEIGNLYPASSFTGFTTTYHDFLLFTVENDAPVLRFQPGGNDDYIKVGYVPDSNPAYLVEEDGQFRLITYTNVSTLAIAYFDKSFRNWMKNGHHHVFSNQEVKLKGIEYKEIMVFTNPNTYNSDPHLYQYVTENIPEYPHTTLFWTELSLDSVENYVNNLSNIGIKLYSGPRPWNNSEFSEKIVSIYNTGLTELTNLEFDKLYEDDRFEVFENTYHDFLLMRLDKNGQPMLTYQPKGTQGNVSHCIIKNSNPSTGYVLKEGTQNRFLGYSNVSTLGFCYVNLEYIEWLSLFDNNFQHLFPNNVKFNDKNYSVLTVKGYIFSGKSYFFSLDKNSNVWNQIDTENIKDYIQSMDIDVKLLESVEWYTETVINGIRDAHAISFPIENHYPNDPTLVNNPGANLIYAKSLYEESEQFLNIAIQKLETELREEEIVKNNLSTSDSAYVDELQTFINDKTAEVETKLNHIKSLRENLENCITKNQILIQANEDLHDLLNSQEAKNLTKNILSIRDEVYNSFHFLMENNRLGTNNDTVYIIPKTSL